MIDYILLHRCNALILVFILLLFPSLREAQFPLSAEHALTTADQLAIVRGSSVGLTHLDYYVGEKEFCDLDLFERDIPERFCQDITHDVCGEELILRFRSFKENCTSRAEYCSTKQRTQTFYAESVLCFRSKLTTCPDGKNSTSSFNITVLEKEIQEEESVIEEAIRAAPKNLTCHENRVAVCTEIPQTVTITEKKEKCRRRQGRKIVEDLKTEKFCVTYTNGSWTCKDLERDSSEVREDEKKCITRESIKMVNSEIVEPKLNCVYKKLRPFCHPPECKLDNNTGASEDSGRDSSTSSSLKGKAEERFGHLEKDGISVELMGKDLWRRFYKLGTEMIITKAGRRMFPTLKIRLKGLDPCQSYVIYLEIEPYDDKRYRYIYQSSEWTVAGAGDLLPPMPPSRHFFVHEESPALGAVWSSPQNVVSFDKLKLTNNRSSIFDGHICLHSMHKYIPRVHIQTCDPSILDTDGSVLEKFLDPSLATTFVFKETSFTTVTAYQNQQITKLKIESNPFAKGFREATRTRDPFLADYLFYSSLYLPGFHHRIPDERYLPPLGSNDFRAGPSLRMMMAADSTYPGFYGGNIAREHECPRNPTQPG